MRAIICLSIICFLIGCQIHRPPGVEINSPKNGQVFNIGDSVGVEAYLIDSDILLGEYLTVVTGKSYLDTILKFEDHARLARSYNLSKKFIINTADTFRIIVRAYGGSSISVTEEVFVIGQ